MTKMRFAMMVIVTLFCIPMIAGCATEVDHKKNAETLWNIAKGKIVADNTQEALFPKEMEISDKSLPNHVIVVSIPDIEVWILREYDGKNFVIVPRAYAIESKAQPVIKAVVYLVNGANRKEIGNFQAIGKAVVVESNGTRKLLVE